MKYFAKLGLSVCLCLVLAVPQLLAADNEAIAKKLVDKVPGDAQRPTYYTGKHSFMNDADLNTEGGPLEKGFYLMSWLGTNPPIKVAAGTGGTASLNKPFYDEYFGVKEEDVSADRSNWPRAGLKSKKPIDEVPLKGKDIYWTPFNFQDLVDAGEAEGFNSGNEFDWKEWTGSFRGLDDFHMYIFCLVKWDNDAQVSLVIGSDDPSQTYANGIKVVEILGDNNWNRSMGAGDFNVKGGEWVAMLAEIGERGGECGYTIRVEPPPNDHTLDVETVQAVDPRSKLTTTWGGVKFSY